MSRASAPKLVSRKAAAIAVIAMLAACHKATFVRDVPPAGPVHSEWHRFHLFGLVGIAEVDVRDTCPDGDVRIVRTGGNLGTALVTAVTLGIYSPRVVWIQCGDTPAQAPPEEE